MNDEKHEWRVGDLCRALYNEIGTGTIYRVVGINVRPMGNWKGYQTLTIVPLLGSLPATRSARSVSSASVTATRCRWSTWVRST